MNRIELQISDSDKKKLIELAHKKGLNLNAYLKFLIYSDTK